MSLDWEYRLQDGCYAVEGICYCEKPVAPELQSLNIYVPESLMGKKRSAARCRHGHDSARYGLRSRRDTHRFL